MTGARRVLSLGGLLLLSGGFGAVLAACGRVADVPASVERRALLAITRDILNPIMAPSLNHDGSGGGLDVTVALPGGEPDCSALAGVSFRLPPAFELVSEQISPQLNCDLGDARPGQMCRGTFEGLDCRIAFINALRQRDGVATGYPLIIVCDAPDSVP